MGYTHPDNVLRGSVLSDPNGARANTKDNTPAVVHTKIVAGDKVEIEVAAKGGGSEAKAKFAMLNPSDSVVDWILSVVPTMGAGWCPPGIFGCWHWRHAGKSHVAGQRISDGTAEHARTSGRGARDPAEELRMELFEKVNALGIGAQGLGRS